MKNKRTKRAKKEISQQRRRLEIANAPVESNLFLQSYKWREIRMKVLVKYGAACQCCGASAKTGATIKVDHIKPRKKYPELALDINNLQVLCGACNQGKGNWDETDWRPAEGVQFDPLDGLDQMLRSF